jgi:hypothetical protein
MAKFASLDARWRDELVSVGVREATPLAQPRVGDLSACAPRPRALSGLDNIPIMVYCFGPADSRVLGQVNT